MHNDAPEYSKNFHTKDGENEQTELIADNTNGGIEEKGNGNTDEPIDTTTTGHVEQLELEISSEISSTQESCISKQLKTIIPVVKRVMAPPMIGMLIGLVIGLIGPVKNLFFVSHGKPPLAFFVRICNSLGAGMMTCSTKR